jgi:hypothetical protein
MSKRPISLRPESAPSYDGRGNGGFVDGDSIMSSSVVDEGADRADSLMAPLQDRGVGSEMSPVEVEDRGVGSEMSPVEDRSIKQQK